jgi:hypothetical protein
VVYRPIPAAHVVSPIIMSRRLQDESPATTLMCSLARELFRGGGG